MEKEFNPIKLDQWIMWIAITGLTCVTATFAIMKYDDDKFLPRTEAMALRQVNLDRLGRIESSIEKLSDKIDRLIEYNVKHK